MKKWYCKATASLCALALAAGILPASAFAASPAVVTADFGDIRQEIDGFGVTQEEEATYVMQEPFRTRIMDLLYSQTDGIGLSILRTEIGCGDSAKATVEPEPGVWNREPDPRELWYFHEAASRGVEKIYGTAWTPPAWMKTNRNIVGGYLAASHYQDYADYLAEYVKIYRDIHGIDLYGVSFLNEPELPMKWKSCCWTGGQIRDFLKYNLGPAFAREGLSANIMGPETGMWSEMWMNAALDDPQAAAVLDIVTSHQYQGGIKNLPKARASGKRLWLSELCDDSGAPFHTSIEDAVGWAKIIHSFLTVPEVNAFLYWRGAHTTDSNQTLIRLDTTQSYTTTKRLFALGNYSRFIRPGWVRVGATEQPYSDVLVSAYQDPATGKFAVVMVNTAGQNNRPVTLRLNGASSGVLTPTLTDQHNDLKRQADISAVNGEFTVWVGANSVVTLVGEPDTQPAPQVFAFTDTLDDESKLFSRTDGWMIEAGNQYGRYDDDFSCLRRTALSEQSVVYRTEGMREFLATFYTCDDDRGIRLLTSSDGAAFAPLEPDSGGLACTCRNWNRLRLSGALPPDANYLKIVFSGGTDAWNKHLAELSLR